jgi:hypothetical protein
LQLCKSLNTAGTELITMHIQIDWKSIDIEAYSQQLIDSQKLHNMSGWLSKQFRGLSYFTAWMKMTLNFPSFQLYSKDVAFMELPSYGNGSHSQSTSKAKIMEQLMKLMLLYPMRLG